MEGDKKRYLFILKTEMYAGAERRMAGYCSGADFTACDITWIVLKDAFSDRFKAEGLPVRVVEFPPETLKGKLSSRIIAFSRFIAQQRPDVIVASNFGLRSLSTWEMMIASLITRGNTYMIVHDCPYVPVRYPPKRHFGFIPGIGLSWRLQSFNRSLFTRIPKRTFAVNDRATQHLVRHFNFSPERTATIRFGVDLDYFKPDLEHRQEVRRRYGIGQQDIVLVSTSRLHKRKRLDRALEAFAAAARDRNDLWLLLAGQGKEYDMLSTLARSYGEGVSRRIIFTGFVTDIAPISQAGDIFLLTSDSDAFVNSLHEAMACGLLPVITKCIGPEEYVTDGVTGIVVENSTEGVVGGMRRALSMSEAERSAMGARARAFVEKTSARKAGIEEFLTLVGMPRRAAIAAAQTSMPAPSPT